MNRKLEWFEKLIIIGLIAVFGVSLFLVVRQQEYRQTRPCSSYSNENIDDIPYRCLD